MTSTHGFELIREETIAELNTQAQLWRHQKTGAELLSLINDDENKVFGITFRTPPTDSTGIAHIMEHSVLCGSRKYPIKEPFVELLKGSLNTFLNAMTYPDKTCYPVASQNLQDFRNLVDVYLDAVFFPRITPPILQQEGWHYELESADDPLVFKGVVFNEMKGAYSSPDSVLYRASQQSLYPDTTYGVDSGGDPTAIPDLTYEQFKGFHETFYHPSNARIFFYGDDPADERLQILDAYLSEFEPIEVASAVALQKPFSEPQQLRRSYAVAEDGAEGKKGLVTVNWMLGEGDDPETSLALGILEYILIGTPAAPLRKVLIESGLGEDLAGVGLGDSLRQVYFSTGLKGIALEDAPKVEQLILATLQGLAENGIDAATVEAAINTVEFRLRENNTGSFPRGLALMIRSLETWLYEGDPLAPLRFEAPLAAIKERLAAEPYFEGMIRRSFLENNHRTTLVLEPDPEASKRADEAERARLDAARATMSEQDIQDVIESTRQLKLMQETPDTPEALASVPNLKREDLDKTNKVVPITVLEEVGCKLLYHDLFTNGVVYLDLGFNLRMLPQELLPYVPLFGRALLEMGTEGEDFVQLAQRIGRTTGGIRPTNFTSAISGSTEGTAWLFLRGKAMLGQTEDLLAIFHDILMTVRLDNQERFRQLVLEEKAGEEAGLVPGGHQVVRTRLCAQLSEADWAAEQMGGVSYLFFLRQLAEQIDSDWPGVLAALEQVRSALVNRNAMVCNLTLDEAGYHEISPRVAGLLAALPGAVAAPAIWIPQRNPAFEGLTIPAQVNYVGKGANLYDLGYSYHGSAAVISKYLRTTWLWERIRVLGGAYGGFCVFDRNSGVWSYLSYRDPNLLGTLANYDQTSQFLRDADINDDELTKSIVGTIGDMDGYQLPDAKGYSSMLRHLIGDDEQRRQRIREEVLGTTAADFKAFAELLQQVNQRGSVVVLGSAAAIEAANSERGGAWLDVVKVL